MPAAMTDSLPAPKAALMQPTFMPWLGYFALIADSDIFVFLDDFQFVRRSFAQRNRFCDKSGKEIYISVPIKHTGHQEINLNEAAPLIDGAFRKKFLGTLQQCYARSPYYDEIKPMMEEWIGTEFQTLADLNIDLVLRVSRYLGWDTDKFRLSNTLKQNGQRSERILSLLNAIGAKTYLCAKGAQDYMEEDKVFPVSDCLVAFQDFVPAPYGQSGKFPFFSHLSIVDVLMNLGKAGTLAAIEEGRQEYRIWAMENAA